MKKRFIVLVYFLSCLPFLYAQDQASDFSGKSLREREHASQTDMSNYIPDEVIVKFKDNVSVSNSGKQLKSTGISNIDQIISSIGADKMTKVFPSSKKLKSARIIKTPTGQELKVPSLHNIYKITIPRLKSSNSDIPDVINFIKELEEQPEVEYAEPNYIYSIGEFNPGGPKMSMLQAMEQGANQNISQKASGLIPNDPLYNSQWGIPATNIDDVWKSNTGNISSIIAILDTGVDNEHPDLKNNIWRNEAEINGAEGHDDDGNGYVDDFWGWDFINEDNDPKDDNSHGTHCAGIAAATGDNGIGIAGVNWKAKIMTIKVFQSSGKGDAATIAQGILYAVEKGANVLSMSFGSYAKSITMHNALANAYATSVLVAAAGNDALCIGPGLCPDRRIGRPLYPAAYPFVLGITANQENLNSNGIKAGFSNYDQDGPVFSQYTDLLNYELKAPGVGIISTIPGGNYREYNGTSMAVPLVAGAISLYREQKPEESQEKLFGNFIHTSAYHIDLENALNTNPEPVLNIVSYELQDSIEGYGDGRADVGETIDLIVTVRNTWGEVSDVKTSVEFEENEDQSTADILVSEATIGSISAYAKKTNEIPLKIKIDEDVVDGRDIQFVLKTWYGNHLGEKSKKITLKIENGVELKGILSEDLTLYPDKHYIITDNLAVSEDVTLTIKPGTTLKFAEEASILVAGNVNAIGHRDSTINFTKRDNDVYWGGIRAEANSTLNFEFCKFEYGGLSQHVFGSESSSSDLKHCLFSKNLTVYNNQREHNIVERSCFYYNIYDFTIKHCRFTMNNVVSNKKFLGYCHNSDTKYEDYFQYNNIFSNQHPFSDNQGNFIIHEPYEFQTITLDSAYFGSTNIDLINQRIIDFPEKGYGPWIDLSKMMTTPSSENHGIVWKVLVNGKDAQDEFDLMDPIGVGKHKVDVYFNRPMDTAITPSISMGVKYPFTQTVISNNGSWNTDATIYTAYFYVGLLTGDGLNTIRVADAQDLDHFEIPIEDHRFQVVVNAAGSLSDGFEASPEMGRVKLAWEAPGSEVDDLLGYNMYRYKYMNDTVTSDTTLINPNLITDTEFTDFEVEPGTKYFYAYKTARTNLSESDYSKEVSAVPLSASTGDANGDLDVDVSDIVTLVNYILENNPKPFILEAADINEDESIDVLDIVGLINIILSPESQSLKNYTTENAKISLKNDTVYVDTPVELGGIQFTLAEISSEEELEILNALDGFELIRSMKDGKLTVIAYSLIGKTIKTGKSAILKLKNKKSWIYNSILSNGSGRSVQSDIIASATDIQTLKLNAGFNLGQNYPNPFTGITTIPFELDMNINEAELSIFDIMGREIASWNLNNLDKGDHVIEWDSKGRKGVYVYKMNIIQDGQSSFKKTKLMLIN